MHIIPNTSIKRTLELYSNYGYIHEFEDKDAITK
jgi:hypothetical protein